MRDPNRIHRLMVVLEDVWNHYPDWRFMQLINNIQRARGHDMFYIEDDKLETILIDYIAAAKKGEGDGQNSKGLDW